MTRHRPAEKYHLYRYLGFLAQYIAAVEAENRHLVAEAGASRVREELALQSKAEGRVDRFAARELHFEA